MDERCRPPAVRIAIVRASARAWPPEAACSCGRSRRSDGSGADAGRARPTTSTSPSAVASRAAGAEPGGRERAGDHAGDGRGEDCAPLLFGLMDRVLAIAERVGEIREQLED